uniref:Uncharacterized protein n=1 Tax=Liagoropsis maxima TaxID=1653392 RepID=A0A1G4NVS0_9FLOR|nr:Hypothetical protein ORF_3 [Liagoropsis maxima]SCW22760.1 Hypothetical protein ORF_3 [Liagoropsis maxima]
MKIVLQDIQYVELFLSEKTINEIRKSLFYLQKKIYQASKECHYSMVHSFQKLLISLFSIHKLAQHIVIVKYCKTNKPIYTNPSSFINNHIIIQQINKQLMLWCLEAEWQDKLKLDYNQLRTYVQTPSYYISQSRVYLKNCDINYLVDKLQSISWIHTKLIVLFNKQTLNQVVNHYPEYLLLDTEYSLVSLLNSILLNGLQWVYYQQKLQYISDDIIIKYSLKYEIYILNFKKCSMDKFSKCVIDNFLYNISLYYGYNNTFRYLQTHSQLNIVDIIDNIYNKSIVTNLTKYLKNFLYHKDKLGRVRINSNQSIRLTITHINTILYTWLCQYRTLFTYNDLSKIDSAIELMLYKWMRKKRVDKNYSNKVLKRDIRPLSIIYKYDG